MVRPIILFLSFLVFVVFLQNCKHSIDPLQKNADTTGIDTSRHDTIKPAKRPCSPDTVYYARDIQPIFNANCLGSGCHSGTNPADKIDLSSYLKAMASGKIKPYNASGSKVYQSIIDNDPNDRMPPSGALPADKIALIQKWIQQGAKDLWCDDMLGPCDTTTVTYSKTITKIMTDNCVGCHGTSGGVTLTNYNGVKTVVTNGKLWNSINHLSGAAKAMPNSTTKLSSCNLRQIKLWIDAGAPQN